MAPTDVDIRATLLKVMRDNADDELNVKKIRKLAEEKLKVDLSSRKDFVRDAVHELIALHFASDDDEDEDVPDAITQPDENEAPEGEDEQGEATVGVPSKSSDEAPESEAVASSAAVKGWRLFVPKQALRSKSAIVQLDDAEVDFQNDTGVVGRVEVQDRKLTVDIKGQQYRATLRPCATLMVVDFSKPGEAKVDTVTDEFMELSGKRSVMTQMSGKILKGNINRSKGGDSEGSEDEAPADKRKSKAKEAPSKAKKTRK